MSCTNCDDNKIPMTLAQGSDGEDGTNGNSIFLAFASDNAGSDFSYIPSASLPYISFVSKVGDTVTQAEFTLWTKYFGNDGAYVASATITNGELILTLSNGETVNAGKVTCCELTWTNLPLVNGWTTSTETVEYAIDAMGFVHFRGTLVDTAATASAFTSIVFTGVTQNLYSSIADNGTASSHSRLTISYSRADVSVDNYGSGGTDYWILDSVPPIFLR